MDGFFPSRNSLSAPKLDSTLDGRCSTGNVVVSGSLYTRLPLLYFPEPAILANPFSP